MGFASVSLSSCLEVVPEETREWKPEMAPQAMVVNRTGKMGLPAPVSGLVTTKVFTAAMLPMSGRASTTAMTARASMAYSRKELR